MFTGELYLRAIVEQSSVAFFEQLPFLPHPTPKKKGVEPKTQGLNTTRRKLLQNFTTIPFFGQPRPQGHCKMADILEGSQKGSGYELVPISMCRLSIKSVTFVI